MGSPICRACLVRACGSSKLTMSRVWAENRFRVEGLGFRVWALGFGVKGLEFKIGLE